MLKKSFLTLLTMSLFVVFSVSAAINDVANKKADKTSEQGKQSAKTVNAETKDATVLYTIDFEKGSKTSKDARAWMEKQGFVFKSDAKSQSDLNLSFKNSALDLKSKSGIFGIMLKELNVKDASKIRITWEIKKFPEKASYKNGVNNEALMIYVYFGDKKLSSGSMFIPNSPYFLGLFLGKNEDLNKPVIGKHFSEGGRFICIGMPKEGETVTSVFDLSKAFLQCFKKEKTVPYISAVALEVETSNSGPGESFIKKIEFLK